MSIRTDQATVIPALSFVGNRSPSGIKFLEILKENVAPPLGLFSAQIRPLWAWTISLQIASPRLVPPAPVLVLDD